MLKYRKIDENSNNTQIAYHATNNDFNEFDSSFIKRFDYGKGFYFTVNKAYAENYGEYLLTCEIPEDKYFLDLDIAWDNDNKYIQEALVELWMSIKNVEDKLKLEEVMFRDYCNTGWWIYNVLTEIYDTTEQAQDLLYQYGIKGLYSFDGDCYIVFKKEDIKILNKQKIKESYKNNKRETQPEVPTATNVPGFPLNEGSSCIINKKILDHPNTIDNWIKNGGVGALTSQLLASDTSKSSSVTLSNHPPINIINQKLDNLNPYNEKSLQNFNEMSLFKSKITDFKEFYNFVENLLQTNPKIINKIYYKVENLNFGIPANTIRHSKIKHNITEKDWEYLIKNITKPELFVEAKHFGAFEGTNYLLKYNFNYKNYGLGVCNTTKHGYLVTTFFEDKENSIDNWLEGNGKAQPKMPTAKNMPGFPLSEGLYINIINQKLNNLNPYNKKSLQNEKLEKAEIQYGYSTIDTIISFDPSNYELQGLLNKYKALRVLVAQEPGSGKLQLICMPATSGDHGLLATWLIEQGYKIFRDSFYHIVNSEKGPFLTLDSFYKNSEDLKYELLDELNFIYDNQELINKMLDEYYMLKELLPSIVNTKAIDYAIENI